MGKKTLYATIILSVGSVAINIACLTQKFHVIKFNGGGMGIHPFGLFKISTFLTKVETAFGPNENTVCAIVQRLITDPKFCKAGDDNVQPIADAAQFWCNGYLQEAWPNLCGGLSHGAPIGTAFVAFSAINHILQVAGCILAYLYVSGSPKKKYREVSQLLIAVGFGVMLTMQLLYYFLVLALLDDVQPGPGLLMKLGSTVMSASKGNGVSIGWMLNWISLLLQLIVVVLYQFAKSGDEARLAEAREFDRFTQEVEMHNQAMGKGPAPQTSSYGPWGGPPINSAGGFQYPPSQSSSFGLAAPTNAPPPGWGAPAPMPATHSGQGPPYF